MNKSEIVNYVSYTNFLENISKSYPKFALSFPVKKGTWVASRTHMVGIARAISRTGF